MIDGLFDIHFRLDKIDKNGDPLARLNQIVDWNIFRPQLNSIREKDRKSPAGAKGYDPVMMFKILVLQSLYNLSDDQIEFQILDRISFIRFLGLSIGGKVPDATTVWRFREALIEAGLVENLFKKFDAFLRDNGFAARKGQIVDASIVQCPRQRNTREENREIKRGNPPEADAGIDGWSDKKRAQKDTEARWTKKNGRSHFGYKNHIQIDAQHKMIRAFAVTDASVHDSRQFEKLLDENNTSREVWADSAYRSEGRLAELERRGFRERLQRKGCRNKPLSEREKRGNRTRSKVRSRVEHVFGVQAMRAGNLLLRTIGQVRASCVIGLRNLAYNLDRYAMLKTVRA